MKLAEGILKGVQDRTGLDVGDFPETEKVAGTAQADPTRLTQITAHIIARAFDRVGFLRKFSREAEGDQRRSGFLSDVLAAAQEIWRRNPDKVQELATTYVKEFNQRRVQRTGGKPNASG